MIGRPQDDNHDLTRPAAGAAGFDDDQIGLVGFKQCLKEAALGSDGLKRLFLGCFVVNANH